MRLFLACIITVVVETALFWAAGYRKKAVKGIGIWAAAALVLMMVGSIGTGIVPPQYFGIVERFSVFAAVGFNAVLGWYLFNGFEGMAE